MAIEALLAELEQAGADECERVLAEAAERAARIRAAAAEAVEREGAAWLAPRERALRVQAARETAAARRRARDAVLAARADVLARVLEAAREELTAAGESTAYRERLPAHVEEAIGFLGDAPAGVRCRPADADLVREALGARPATVHPDAAMPPGVIVEAADGSVTIDNTLPARLARALPGLAVDVAAALEPSA